MKRFTLSTLAIAIIYLFSACHSEHNHDHHDTHAHHGHNHAPGEPCTHDHASSTQGVLEALQPNEDYDNILIEQLESDSLSSSFVIWVKNNVKRHYHAHHTENIYVIAGRAKMVVGDDTSVVVKGDYMMFPPKIEHEVIEVISNEPLKVLSIQSPEFFGKDRIFVD